MQYYLNNIDNKEIFTKIMHLAVDYLIGNQNDKSTLKLCHKFGFQNPDDFLSTTKTVAKAIQNSCYELGSEHEIPYEFANINVEMQPLVIKVLAARKQELFNCLLKRSNALGQLFLESFNWDLLLVRGDSSIQTNNRILATTTLTCTDASSKQSFIHLQLNRKLLEQLISSLEIAATKTPM